MYTARLRLAGIFVPLLVASLVVPAALIVRGTTFAIGVAFFSQPVISRLTHHINHRFPNWRKLVELRRTLLKGVPTNAQLTLTLLRIAEAAKAPLPPPPIARPHHTAAAADAANPAPAHPPQAADALKEHDFAFDTDNYEIDGVDPDHPQAYANEGVEGEYTDQESVEGGDEGKETKKKKGSKVLGLIKKTAHTGVSGILGMDHLKAKVGNEHSKRRLGAVAPPPDNPNADGTQATVEQTADEKALAKERADEALRREGPTSFSGRLHGKKGRLLLVTAAASPCLSWIPEKSLRSALMAPSKIPGKGGDEAEGLPAELTIGLSDIVSLRKLGGFGWKGRLVVGWATGRDVVDGLEIVDRWGGRKVFTAIRGRDELFNRLLAMGKQSWECL